MGVVGRRTDYYSCYCTDRAETMILRRKLECFVTSRFILHNPLLITDQYQEVWTNNQII